jgi:hypothetical protein
VVNYSGSLNYNLFLGGFVMGNKLDILRDYQVAEAEAMELDNVCHQIDDSKLASEFLKVYDEKRKSVQNECRNLQTILEAIEAAED